MWETREVLSWGISPLKILLHSFRILHTNKLVFSCILALITLPLSSLIFSLTLYTHNLRSQVYHLEAVAFFAPTRMEARHVWWESRQDAFSLLRIKALFSIPCYLLSVATAVSAVNSTLLACHGKTPTLHSVAAALKNNWKRPFITTIFIYAILLAFALVPWVLAAPIASRGLRFLVLAIGSGVEVYLMALLSLGLVVSIAEERFGWEAIKVGSDLMQGQRFCGWVLSGLFVLISGLINWKVEALINGQNSPSEFLPSPPAFSFQHKMVLICSYGLVVLWSYVVITVFYCDRRRRHVIKEPESQDDDDGVSV